MVRTVFNSPNSANNCERRRGCRWTQSRRPRDWHRPGAGAAGYHRSRRADGAHGGDRSAAATARAYVLTNYPSQLSDLRDAIDARDVDRLRPPAHTLRGAMSLFAASEAAEAARELERAADLGGQPSTRRFRALQAELARLEPTLLTLVDGVQQ